MPLYRATAAAAGGVTPGPFMAGGRSGIWYPISLPYDPDGSAIILPAGEEIAAPFISLVSGTLDRIGFGLNTPGSSGSVTRLGIRADTGNGFPSSTVILDAGTFDTSSGSGSATINISQAVSAGTVYWLTICAQGAPVTEPIVGVLAAGSNRHTLVGHSSADAALGPHWSSATSPKQTGITGALPSSWTGTAKFSYWPQIVVRFA